MKRIHNVLNHIHGSLTTNKDGYSARKLSAFLFMGLVVFIHAKYLSNESAYEFLIVDCAMILILLGIVTIQNIIEFKNGTTPQKEITNG